MTIKKKQDELVEMQEQDTTWYIGPATTSDALGTIASYPAGVNSGRKHLATALAKAQAECQNVVMNKTNPHFRSRYADLSAVRDAIVPVFAKHGLSIVQAPSFDEFTSFKLETILMHESGESLTWWFPLPNDVNKMQQIGSAISYARRYTLSAIAGIASEEDDDGNAAQIANGGGQSASRGSGAGTKAGGDSPSPNGGIVL